MWDAASCSLVAAVRRKPEWLACGGERWLVLGFSDEAVYHYAQAVALNPTHVDALHNLGAAMLHECNLCSTLAGSERCTSVFQHISVVVGCVAFDPQYVATGVGHREWHRQATRTI